MDLLLIVLWQMCPGLSMDDHADVALRDTVFSRKSSLCDVASSVTGAYLSDYSSG
jgi:hypothetical protein